MPGFIVTAGQGGNFNLALADGGVLPVQDSNNVGPGTGPNPATSQTTWFVDPVNGNNNNAGNTAATAVKTAAEIKRRWTGGVAGTRVQLGAVAITVTALTNAPDNSDPWCVLLDVDQQFPGSLVLQGAPLAATRTGTLATASAFARTSAGGQITITDAGVPDFHAFPMPSLFIDTTKTGVGWLYEPLSGSSANGIVSPNRSPATPGTSADAATTVAAADNYQLVPLVTIYMGSGSEYRSFPALPNGNNPTASVYRLRLGKGGQASDTCQLKASDSATIFIQECQLDTSLSVVDFVVVQNCWSTNFQGASERDGQNNPFFLAGGSYAALQVFQGAVIVSNDFVWDTATNSGFAFATTRGVSSFLRIGTASTWGLATAASPSSGSLVRIAGFTASDVFYGKVGGGNPIFNLNMDAILQARAGDATFSSALQFDSSTFQFNSQGNGFGFNTATGAIVGPTTLTTAHVDAALAAGTGFGGFAQDPRTGANASSSNG